MLHYDRNDSSEGVDLTKSKNSKECKGRNYQFFNHGFKLKMLCINPSDNVFTVKGVDHGCIIHDISKSDAIYLLESYVLDNRGYIQKAFQRNQY